MGNSSFASTPKPDLLKILMVPEAVQPRISDLFLEQLRHGLMTDAIHPHKVIDEIRNLELGKKSATKAADTFKHPPLKGYWKKHFFQTTWMIRNIMNEWKMGNPRSEKFKTLYFETAKKTTDPHAFSSQISHKFVIEAFEKRVQKSAMDGEWIVFDKYQDQNYYLTIAFHSEKPEVIHERILSCQSQFPFLFSASNRLETLSEDCPTSD